MTRYEMLLTMAMEECAELQQRISKAQRFGMDERQAMNPVAQPTDDPDARLTNRARIIGEFNDLLAVLDMLDLMTVSPSQMDEKKRRVEKYLEYSKTCGTVH